MFNWISFLTYAVVTAVTPGPNNILSMSNGNRKGFRGALPFNFGILVGLLYLAWETVRSSGVAEEDDSRDCFRSGLLLQFINPKIYIYCIMSMEAYILPYYHGRVLPLVGFALLLAFIGFAFTLLWSAFGSVFQWLFSQHTKLVNTVRTRTGERSRCREEAATWQQKRAGSAVALPVLF